MSAHIASPSASLPDEYYRAGVGALIINHEGEVLVFERQARPGAWQFPQGGIDRGEALDVAILREIFEETGLTANRLTLIEQHPDPLAYDLPVELRKPKTGRGQVQYWFLFQLNGDAESIPLPIDGEFSAWRWVRIREFLPEVIPFRQRVYQQLATYFAHCLK